MSRVYNFSAGPAVLPEEVLKEAAAEMLDYKGCGMSVMEMSHRSSVFQEIIETAEADIRDLMQIPDNYKVLFLQGGASQQFAMIPMNLMKNKVADYIVTGQWAKKAAKEAEKYGEVHVVASSEDKTFSYIPDCSDLEIPEDADFSNFRLDYYSRSHYDKKTGRSAREAMENTLEICRHFVDSFGTEFHNLFLYGDVGVGKTYLSTCIAKEIINREFSVIYFSAPQLFNTLAQNTFDKKDVDARNMSEYIFECDLLIIDDLGTEYTNSFIASQFFTCINERLLHRKSTIISTNLSLESLADLYTERSFSRITSSYSLLKIIGDDIRIKKKLEH